MVSMSNTGVASSSCSTPVWWKYDVFLSFRGEDTRKNFTDHLTKALDQRRVLTFRDDRSLQRGKPIAPELLKAIEESRFAIIVLSKTYASSSWCLEELCKIVECMKSMGQIIFPIFYDVDPSEVRKQSGNFEGAFQKHDKTFYVEKVQKWREALTEVANLSGWHLQDMHEAAFIQGIVKEIASKLNSSCSIEKDLIGLDSRLQEIDLYLGLGSEDVRFVGICGMGGIGKTTIAQVIYNRVSFRFEGSCFIANVRGFSGFSLVSLQEQILSQILAEENINIPNIYRGMEIIRRMLRAKRVLIVLDDVDKFEQLETLAGNLEWFGQGSRVIITTRDQHLLNTHNVDRVYKVKSLNNDEALRLFSLNAFKQNHPAEDYMELSKHIANYATGLPLALKVLGCFLCGRTLNEWRNALKRLEKNPNREIFDILKISYDGLDEIDKKIFLDVSCFFNWKNVDRVTEILDSFDFHSELGIRVLVERSLVSIDNDKICVHSLLEEMARVIIHQQSPTEPGRRSRLWSCNDIHHVITKKTGTDAVEVIYLDTSETKEIYVDADAFSRMYNLRLLKLQDANLLREIKFLPSELRILKWHGYSGRSLPSSLRGEKLVEIKMSHSRIEQLWKGVMELAKLKVIKLSHSRNLSRTPNFEGVPNLERLILQGCTSLCELHPSISSLKRLILLNLNDCKNLKNLPRKVTGWNALKVLLLLGCSKIVKLPENLVDMECLEELDLGRTAIIEVPSSIVLLKNLKKLSFYGCKGPKPWNCFHCILPVGGQSSTRLSLPPLSGLFSLTDLNLSDCNLNEGAIPSDIGCLFALKELDLSKNNFVSLPESISKLSNLQSLRLRFCRRLQTLPELPSSIERVAMHNCSSLEALGSPLGLSISWHRDFFLNNCFRLSENQHGSNVPLSLLKSYLCSLVKVHLVSSSSKFFELVEKQSSENVPVATALQEFSNAPSTIPCLSVFVPGSEIPNWFKHRATSDLLIIELPAYWYDDLTFLGFAICAAFEARDRLEDFGLIDSYDFSLSLDSVGEDGKVSVEYDTNIYSKEYSFDREDLDFSNHLWLQFIHFHELVRHKNCNKVRVCFEFEGPGLDIKNYGVRLVFIPDVELNPNIFQGINLSQLQDLTIELSKLHQPVLEQSQNNVHHSKDKTSSSQVAFDDEETHGNDSMRGVADALLDPKGKGILA